MWAEVIDEQWLVPARLDSILRHRVSLAGHLYAEYNEEQQRLQFKEVIKPMDIRPCRSLRRPALIKLHSGRSARALGCLSEGAMRVYRC